jgi:hypothetical protein
MFFAKALETKKRTCEHNRRRTPMRMREVLTSLAAISLLQIGAMPVSAGEKPTVTKPCTNCHDAAAGVVRGKLTNLSNKSSSLQVNVGKAVWVFDFDGKTAFQNVEGVKKLKKNKEIAITYKEVDGSLYASLISTKPKFEVAEGMLVDTAFIEELVRKSPADGGYVLVDARPGPKFEEGHIRHAVSMPLFAFDKKKDQVLPAKKDAVLVFYCGGVT